MILRCGNCGAETEVTEQLHEILFRGYDGMTSSTQCMSCKSKVYARVHTVDKGIVIGGEFLVVNTTTRRKKS